MLEVIKCSQRNTDNKISFEIVERREGDPAVLVSDNKLALNILKWNPQYNNINTIIKSAWTWHITQQ